MGRRVFTHDALQREKQKEGLALGRQLLNNPGKYGLVIALLYDPGGLNNEDQRATHCKIVENMYLSRK